MAKDHIAGLEKARETLVARRRQLILGIVKLPEGDYDRVARHAEYLTAIQSAIDAIDVATRDEKKAEAGERRRQDRRRAADPTAIPAGADRRRGERRSR